MGTHITYSAIAPFRGQLLVHSFRLARFLTTEIRASKGVGRVDNILAWFFVLRALYLGRLGEGGNLYPLLLLLGYTFCKCCMFFEFAFIPSFHSLDTFFPNLEH